MKTITPQLPTILGSCAAMLIAFVSLMNGTSSGTCMMKALAAFLVFSGFGLVLRFTLMAAPEAADSERSQPGAAPASPKPAQLDMILPGTSVADLLGMPSGDDQTDSAA